MEQRVDRLSVLRKEDLNNYYDECSKKWERYFGRNMARHDILCNAHPRQIGRFPDIEIFKRIYKPSVFWNKDPYEDPHYNSNRIFDWYKYIPLCWILNKSWRYTLVWKV